MKIKEIQNQLTALRALMSEKGMARPDPVVSIYSERFLLYLGHRADGVKDFYRAEALLDCFSAAFAEIEKMPDAEEVSALKYRKALASALEVARQEAIADDFVEPVRGAMDDFTEKALPNHAGVCHE